MTFASNFHMPGAFYADGVHPGLFRPPVSPSPSTDYLASSAFPAEATPKGKWGGCNDIPQLHEADAMNDDPIDGDEYLANSGNNPTAANTGRAYALAGQLDTPHYGPGVDGSEMLGESMFSDSDYRRALGSKRTRDEMNSTPTGPTQLFHLPNQPSTSLGWGSFAFATIGGVVGRVWEFCKGSSGAFKGFSAGGGNGFEIMAEGCIQEKNNNHHGFMVDRRPDECFTFGNNNDYDPEDAHQRVPGHFPQAEYGFFTGVLDDAHNVPGHFPQTDYGYFTGPPGDALPYSGASTPTGPAVKRRHMEHSTELGRNWVVIKEPGSGGSRKAGRRSGSSRQPSRNRNQGPSLTTGRRISTPNPTRQSQCLTPSTTPGRPSSRLSDTGSLKYPPRPASSASFASFNSAPPRSPSPTKNLVTASTASTASPGASTPSQSQPRRRRSSIAPSPSSQSEKPPRSSFGHRRSGSGASTASSRAGTGDHDNSPRLNAEARSLASRRKLEEREADYRMATLNKRLQAMIRQGKEALGTTIEIDGEDGGWEDEA